MLASTGREDAASAHGWGAHWAHTLTADFVDSVAHCKDLVKIKVLDKKDL